LKLYRTLTRPKLRNGAEWRLAVLNDLITLIFVVTAFWWWKTLFAAAFFHWPGHWLLRAAADHDAQWFEVYMRSRSHALILEPHGFRGEREHEPYRILFKSPRWTK
jgi:type IV secretory pathway TrbD component